MSDALEKLKSLGAQKIYEDTHIPIKQVQSVLDENYEDFSRMQFLGFLSIFERDYDIDLEEMKASAIEYYDEQKATQHLADTSVFVAPSKQKNFSAFYFILAFFIFLGALYYTFDVAEKVKTSITPPIHSKQSINNTIFNEKNNTISNNAPHSTLVETNTTKKQIVKKITVAPEIKNSSKDQNLTKQGKFLEILPRVKVWLGYINLVTHKKYQKTFSNELDLNASKEWLFIFGHGYLDIIINGKKIHFDDRHTLRLYYKDGVLKKISISEFKKLNRGHKW